MTTPIIIIDRAAALAAAVWQIVVTTDDVDELQANLTESPVHRRHAR